MHFAPQTEKQLAVKTGQLLATMHPDMAAQAESNVQRGAVRAGPAVMDHKLLLGQTHLAAAIASEHVFPMAAEMLFGAPAPVIATAAKPMGE